MKMTFIGRKTLKNSTFDGNGHKISGINSNGTQTKLFDDIYVSEIKDLRNRMIKKKKVDRWFGRLPCRFVLLIQNLQTVVLQVIGLK